MPIHRRTAMKVRNGRVLKKNNWRLDPGDYRVLPQHEIRLDRRRPREGSRHLITISQLRAVIRLLPDWDEVALGLDAIVLDSAEDCAGWCAPGVVAVCAWDANLWDWWSPEMEAEHRRILDLLAVERVPVDQSAEYRELIADLRDLGVSEPGAPDHVEMRWTEPQARAYQLLHILPHELGHHHDRITTRKGRHASRGEPYAEAYANTVLEQVFPATPKCSSSSSRHREARCGASSQSSWADISSHAGRPALAQDLNRRPDRPAGAPKVPVTSSSSASLHPSGTSTPWGIRRCS